MKEIKIRKVYPLDKMRLGVLFENNKFKKYDVSKLIKRWPVFEQLKNETLFKSARVDCGGHGIAWNADIDLSATEIWENGAEWKSAPKQDIAACEFIADFISLRKKQGFTQQKLEQITGIKQSVIARFETGSADTQFSTINALARAIGCKIALK